MLTPKEYAVSLGLARPGRGRMPVAAHEAINKARAEGMQFADPKVKSSPANNDKPQPPKVRGVSAPRFDKPPAASKSSSVSSAPDSIPQESPRLYGDNTYWTYTNDKGKTVKVNGIQVCTHCKYSLYWHRCSNPSAVTADGIQDLEVHVG